MRDMSGEYGAGMLDLDLKRDRDGTGGRRIWS